MMRQAALGVQTGEYEILVSSPPRDPRMKMLSIGIQCHDIKGRISKTTAFDGLLPRVEGPLNSEDRSHPVKKSRSEPDYRLDSVHVFSMGEDEFDLRGASNCGAEDILFFFPAGIRPVKGNLEALNLLERVHTLRPSIRVVFAGPILDKDYATKFGYEIERLRAFARWLPSIPFQAMRSAYKGADVILNFSFSEGISNVLLEAKAVGKPILASDIPGNRWPVLGDQKDLPAGLLFDLHSPEHFIQQALRLVDDRDLREKLGQGGKDQATRSPGPEEEVSGLIRVYEKVLNQQFLSG